jgi:hypothetical protein
MWKHGQCCTVISEVLNIWRKFCLSDNNLKAFGGYIHPGQQMSASQEATTASCLDIKLNVIFFCAVEMRHHAAQDILPRLKVYTDRQSYTYEHTDTGGMATVLFILENKLKWP